LAVGLPMQPLMLSDDELHQFQSMANSRSLPHSIVPRAQIVLACWAGETNSSIAKRTGPFHDACLRPDPRLVYVEVLANEK
jgi:hypothetical protein